MNCFSEAVILCGGKSKRMNFDKSLLKLNGRYMLEIIREKLAVCFDSIKLCGDAKERLNLFGLEVIEDKIKGGVGPAAGIYSALAQTACDYVFVTACDMPLIDCEHVSFMQRILEYNAGQPEALIPMIGSYIEPLYGFYSVRLTNRFATEINKGNYKIHDILKKSQTLYLDEKFSRIFDENLTMFTNLNYSTDLGSISC